MGSTQYNAIPYPDLTDPPDGPAQMKALADRVDALLHTGIPLVQAGSFNGGPTATTGYSLTITFPRAFTGLPTVVTNLNSGGGTTFSSATRAYGVSVTGFTFNTNSTTAVTFNASLQWLASITPSAPIAVVRMEDGWHTVTATCHTPECPKNGIAIPGILVPDDPGPLGWTGINCGVCGQPITDIIPS
jgi:hypothetical protein